ncbi:neuropeptide S receptor-like [Agrilus planipennis]|uniref:Neuropeptide S receptor-like n=1 Tax=Agrilus planipennis TaxID=224129 RepID=A0A1W4WPG2_AGRPL|nr:neuropeptide S receptor-like [Agrilus planipennis]
MNNVSTVSYDVFGDENLNSFYFYETEQLTVLWILFVVTVTGNGGVLLAVLHSNRKSRMNYFIKHLAFAGKVFLLMKLTRLRIKLFKVHFLLYCFYTYSFSSQNVFPSSSYL